MLDRTRHRIMLFNIRMKNFHVVSVSRGWLWLQVKVVYLLMNATMENRKSWEDEQMWNPEAWFIPFGNLQQARVKFKKVKADAENPTNFHTLQLESQWRDSSEGCYNNFVTWTIILYGIPLTFCHTALWHMWMSHALPCCHFSPCGC